MSHANACLAPRGRLRLAGCVVDDGWTYARAAERFQCSTATAKKWADRYRAGKGKIMEPAEVTLADLAEAARAPRW